MFQTFNTTSKVSKQELYCKMGVIKRGLEKIKNLFKYTISVNK